MSGTASAVIVNADGGARGNPGRAGCGAIVTDADNGDVIAYDVAQLGYATNNVAEYRGLILGLTLAKGAGAEVVTVRMDSQLVVKQMAGRWNVKSTDLAGWHDLAATLAGHFASISYEWVPRGDNAAADWLAKEAMTGRPASLPPMLLGGEVETLQGAASMRSAERVTRFHGNGLSVPERVRETAHLAARFGVDGDAATVARILRDEHPGELAKVWDNLPGERFLRESIQAAPLTWRDGLSV